MTTTPETRYAKCGEVHLAYQTFGQGARDLVVVSGWVSHLDLLWEAPPAAAFYRRLGEFCRVILFDKRGMGLSDRVATPPTLEERTDDIRAVMDAAHSDEAVLFGLSQGVATSLMFATTFSEQASGLILCGGLARSVEAPDYPWAPPLADALAANAELIGPSWGTGDSIDTFAPTVANDPACRAWWAKLERSAASPGMVYGSYLMSLETDVRHLLGAVHVPTLVLHQRGDRAVSVQGGRWLAEQIPHARFVELPGIDHQFWWVESIRDAVASEIEEFMTGVRSVPRVDRILATVVFTDIVSSTEQTSRLGDRRWRDLLDEHDSIARRLIKEARGSVIKCTGDGVLATFDGPGRALRCAAAIRAAVHRLGIAIRVGVHTGEIELRGDDIGGIAVHIAQRVQALAQPSEILVSRTVVDLVAGSRIGFTDRGAHALKGVSGDWHLFAVEADQSPP